MFDRCRELNARVGVSWGYVVVDRLKLEVIEFGLRDVRGFEDGHLLVWKLHRVPQDGKGPFAYVDSGAVDTPAEAWQAVCARADAL